MEPVRFYADYEFTFPEQDIKNTRLVGLEMCGIGSRLHEFYTELLVFLNGTMLCTSVLRQDVEFSLLPSFVLFSFNVYQLLPLHRLTFHIDVDSETSFRKL